ncbi:MAG: hypothetical protein GQE15_40450 [Archangiaceae bacterium]|nr:hypothetical protein [Archangiaceae bacterium]
MKTSKVFPLLNPCRRLVGRPYSGAKCFEGSVGCSVWVQDDRVVGRAEVCWN